MLGFHVVLGTWLLFLLGTESFISPVTLTITRKRRKRRSIVTRMADLSGESVPKTQEKRYNLGLTGYVAMRGPQVPQDEMDHHLHGNDNVVIVVANDQAKEMDVTEKESVETYLVQDNPMHNGNVVLVNNGEGSDEETTTAKLVLEANGAPLPPIDFDAAVQEFFNYTSSIFSQNGLPPFINVTTKTSTQPNPAFFGSGSIKWQTPYESISVTTATAPSDSSTKESTSKSSSTNAVANKKLSADSGSASPTVDSSQMLAPGKSNDDTLTMQDLQEFLRVNGYVKREEVLSKNQLDSRKRLQKDLVVIRDDDPDDPTAPRTKSSSLTSTTSTSSSKGVAFPQASVMSSRDVNVGTTIAGILSGMLGAITILPNLWLIGMVLGGLSGYEVSKNSSNLDETAQTGPLSRLLLTLGRRLAQSYLTVYDYVNGFWFMYKTGQLSYEYYKRYARIDERLALTPKIDAWNARFQQGKINFDRWEQENEVGRKLLAALRTVWLVEEQSLKKGSKKNEEFSRYRLVQYLYNLSGWGQDLLKAAWASLVGDGLRDMLRGFRRQDNFTKARLRAAIVAVCGLNLVVAMFAVMPTFSITMAVMAGLVWPTWTMELRNRLKVLQQDLQEQGRQENNSRRRRRSSKDRKQYHYYTRRDGTQQWYRTGQSPFARKTPIKKPKSVLSRINGLLKTNVKSKKKTAIKKQTKPVLYNKKKKSSKKNNKNRKRRRNKGKNNFNNIFSQDVSWGLVPGF